MSKSKLLFLTYDQPNKLGGPIVNLQRILPRLNKHHNVHLLCFYKKSHPNASKIESDGVNVYYRKKSILDIEYQEIFQLVKKLQPDVFIPDVSHAGWYFASERLKNMRAVVLHVRGDDCSNLQRFDLFKPLQRLNSKLRILAVSEYLGKKASLRLPFKVIEVVNASGVNLTNKRVSICKSKECRICYSGRLEKLNKRVDLVLNIGAQLNNRRFVFTMIGNGSMFNGVPKNSETQFIYTGNLEGKAYKYKLSENHYFMLMSDSEGTPGALLDAMSVGLVPIVNNFPGVEEVIEHGVNGFIVDNRTFSGKDLTNLVTSIDNSRYQELSENAYQTIVNRFSVESSVEKWQSIIDQLLEENTTLNKITKGLFHPKIIKGLAGQGSHIPISNGWVYWMRYILASIKRKKNPFLPLYNLA